jgi:hypothetical protein
MQGGMLPHYHPCLTVTLVLAYIYIYINYTKFIGFFIRAHFRIPKLKPYQLPFGIINYSKGHWNLSSQQSALKTTRDRLIVNLDLSFINVNATVNELVLALEYLRNWGSGISELLIKPQPPAETVLQASMVRWPYYDSSGTGSPLGTGSRCLCTFTSIPPIEITIHTCRVHVYLLTHVKKIKESYLKICYSGPKWGHQCSDGQFLDMEITSS